MQRHRGRLLGSTHRLIVRVWKTLLAGIGKEGGRWALFWSLFWLSCCSAAAVAITGTAGMVDLGSAALWAWCWSFYLCSGSSAGYTSTADLPEPTHTVPVRFRGAGIRGLSLARSAPHVGELARARRDTAFALQELAGWETEKMVRRYAHLAAEHLAVHASNRESYGTNTAQPPDLRGTARLQVVGN